jgi:hypothetical protein
MKRIFLLVLLGIVGSGAMAQKVNVGVHAGWNNAKINVKDLKVTSHSGYMAGIFARFGSHSLYFEPSLNFVHRECDVASNNVKEALTYSSVDVPLVLGIYVVNLRLLKVRGFIGPEVSILTNRLKLKELVEEWDPDKTMWNGKVGGGVDVGNFSLDVDYCFGLKDFGGAAKKPHSITLTLGFKVF